MVIAASTVSCTLERVVLATLGSAFGLRLSGTDARGSPPTEDLAEHLAGPLVLARTLAMTSKTTSRPAAISARVIVVPVTWHAVSHGGLLHRSRC